MFSTAKKRIGTGGQGIWFPGISNRPATSDNASYVAHEPLFYLEIRGFLDFRLFCSCPTASQPHDRNRHVRPNRDFIS